MTDTIISSASKEVVIGFGRPFAIIGERINPTGRRLLAEEMKAGNFSRVERMPSPRWPPAHTSWTSTPVYRWQMNPH